MKEKILSAMVRRRIKKRKKELGDREWWNRECKRKKREVKRSYKKWKQGEINRKSYMEEKKKLKEMYVEKQKKRS